MTTLHLVKSYCLPALLYQTNNTTHCWMALDMRLSVM